MSFVASRPKTGAARATFRSGFTLIELLVAMAITSIIMVTLFSLVGQSTASYTQTQRAVNAVSQARAFMQFFDREISTRLPGTPLIHEKGTGSNPESSDKIAFIRALSGDEQLDSNPGDLGTSAYYVDYSSDLGGNESPKLFRKYLGPSESQAIIETSGTPSFPTTNPPTDEPIIPNILSFQAIPKYRDPTGGELKDWNSSSVEPPSVVELTIRFIDDSSAQRYKSRAEWSRLATSPRENELQFIRTFTRTIAIAK